MKTKYVNINVIDQIKNNTKYYLNFFSEKEYYDNLSKEFSVNYYKDSEFDLQIIDFYMPDIDLNNRKKTDLINSILIYEKYKHLTESQASDERFWVGLTFEKSYLEYLWYRWGKTEKTIYYRMVYHVPGKRGYSYHGLARPWWFAHLTYDEYRNDPYELTRFTYEYPHIMEKMIYRNCSNSKKIRHTTIESVKSFIGQGGIYNTTKIDKLYLYLGVLGSNKLLDIYDTDYLRKKLTDYLFTLQ